MISILNPWQNTNILRQWDSSGEFHHKQNISFLKLVNVANEAAHEKRTKTPDNFRRMTG
jgi:hypothetical protein